MRSKAYVAGMGVVSAIGRGADANKSSLLAGTTGIAIPQYLSTFWKNTFPVGEVKTSNEDLAAITGMSAILPRTALLSAVAVSECWIPFKDKAAGLNIGFFSANTVGGMDLTEDFYSGFTEGNNYGSDASYKYHECGAVTELVARHFNLKSGFVTTISTACSSSANSIMMAAQMIENGMLDIAIAGGADALSRFTLNGFNTLQILDKQPCQPFDGERRGLNLGEGAGYLLLMNEKALTQCGATATAFVSGYANANDAYHQTASSPEGRGNTLAMRQAMAIAGVTRQDIDYINLHGTGTPNNDSAEGKAIETVFGDAIPPATSTTAFTGHTLGGCGGVEAVFSVLSIMDSFIPATLRWQNAMTDINWQPVTALQTGLDIRHVLSNSFGFGGNCSSLIFSRA